MNLASSTKAQTPPAPQTATMHIPVVQVSDMPCHIRVCRAGKDPRQQAGHHLRLAVARLLAQRLQGIVRVATFSIKEEMMHDSHLLLH